MIPHRLSEAEMLLNFAIFTLADSSSSQATADLQARLYPAERLTDMQSLLAALADFETAYETEREQIEQWSGSPEMKQQLLTDLEERHQAQREPYQHQWERLTGKLPLASALVAG